MWEYNGVEVTWLGHDGYVLKGSKTVILDPFKAKGKHKADVLLISHEHSDHLSPDDIKRFSDQSTVIVAPKVCEGPLKGFKNEKRFVLPNSKLVAKGVSIETVPAYNVDKFAEPGKVFHPKEDGRVGYIVTLDGVRFYQAGDTDSIPEMKSIVVDVAFLPVSGTYVMTAEEAAEAAKSINSRVLVPMHYASIVGSLEDAKRFKRLVGPQRTVQILDVE